MHNLPWHLRLSLEELTRIISAQGQQISHDTASRDFRGSLRDDQQGSNRRGLSASGRMKDGMGRWISPSAHPVLPLRSGYLRPEPCGRKRFSATRTGKTRGSTSAGDPESAGLTYGRGSTLWAA
jgi:hypothetical protein